MHQLRLAIEPLDDTRPIPTCQDGTGPICPWCGEERFLDVLEYWPEERAWMFDTCCEGSHQDACEHAAQDPRGFGRWFEGVTGCYVRQGYQSTVEPDFLRLDFGLTVGPVKQADAKAFISEHHRHNNAPAGWKWGLGCYNGHELIAVLWVGRPVARKLDHTKIVEVNRLCVNPDLDPELVWNACSKLYAEAAREAKTRRYDRAITYTLASESGGTLVAAGWTPTHRTEGGSWDRPSRARTDKAPTCQKIRWEKGCNKRARKDIAKRAITL